VQGRYIKPLKIVRSFDRVPNEALEMFSSSLVGNDETTIFNFHMLGDGGLGTEPTPADTKLIHEISRINVDSAPNGGGVTQDGTSYLIAANHPKSVQDLDASESGVADDEHDTHDRMLDHTIYKDPVPHD